MDCNRTFLRFRKSSLQNSSHVKFRQEKSVFSIRQMAQCLWRQFNGRKVLGSNPTSASRLSLCRFGQLGNIPTLVLLSGGMAARHRRDVAADVGSRVTQPKKPHADWIWKPGKGSGYHSSYSGEFTPKGEKHWTRVSLLLELISSAYPVAVTGVEPRTADMRGERVTANPPTHVRRWCVRLIEQRPSNCPDCDDRLTRQSRHGHWISTADELE
ncbi:hypothetical protein CSKR_104585 [Clonorchis sinensis]|uniref:Uncharacterized protein n=1 Tax=Clonorchis sinensis TaxID=79923 RepID=A0A419PE68_CLOSI|nr:hypothetical protein CSKR_104585 [Clonorchis sinensis]